MGDVFLWIKGKYLCAKASLFESEQNSVIYDVSCWWKPSNQVSELPVFLLICPQDKLPSSSLWAERQSSCSCYRIKALFIDTVFYMWFSQWSHPPLYQFIAFLFYFINHNCSSVVESCCISSIHVSYYSLPSFLTVLESHILHLYSLSIQSVLFLRLFH